MRLWFKLIFVIKCLKFILNRQCGNPSAMAQLVRKYSCCAKINCVLEGNQRTTHGISWILYGTDHPDRSRQQNYSTDKANDDQGIYTCSLELGRKNGRD